MKRTINRLILRLAMLCVAVILGAIAVAQAQKGLGTAATTEAPAPSIANVVSTPIPSAPASWPPSAPGFQAAATEPAPTDSWSTPPADQSASQPPSGGDYEAEDSQSSYDEPAPTSEVVQPPPPSRGGDFVADPSHRAEPASTFDPPVQTADPASGYDPAAEAPSVQNVGNEEPATQFDSAPPMLSPPAPQRAAEFPIEPPANPANNFSDLPPMDVDQNGAARAVARKSRLRPADPKQADAQQRSLDFDDDPTVDLQPSFATSPPPPSNAFDSPPNDASYSGAATMQVASPRQPPERISSLDSRGLSKNDDSQGNGKPGPIELEGPQSPTLTVTKSATPEIQVGKPATFQVTVRNVGPVAAHDVVIRDEVPHGTRLVQTVPPSKQAEDGAVVWEMGTIGSGGEVTAIMEVIPLIEGSLGSVATVSFHASASARSIATKPELLLEHTGPGQVLVGDDVIFHIKLSNPGSGIATNVRLEEDVPPGLRHTDGHELEYHVGTIHPGETRLLELTLKADQAGLVDNLLYARADSDLVSENTCQLEIVAPALQVGIEGPTRRYLDRRANFQVQIANPGTAAARDIELVAHLPKGLVFVSSNNAGQYNSQTHAVHWSLAELPAKEMGTVELVTTPNTMGEQRIHVESRARMGLSDEADHQLIVEGLSAILFNVTDLADPIEVGGQTTYDVHILNQGSKVGTNIRLAAKLPDGMQPINGEGPTQATISGQQILFEPLARLAPLAEVNYKIHVKGLSPGDRRIVVKLMSDDVSEPVTKEESTNIYADE